MSKPRWTTGDRRTDAFVVLLVIASSVGGVIFYGLLLCTGEAGWPKASPASAAGLRGAWTLALWLVRGPGTIVPLLIGAAALVRLCGARAALSLVTAYLTVASLISGGWAVRYLLESEARGGTFEGGFWAVAFCWVFSSLAPCAPPLAILAGVCLADQDAARSTRYFAARLTRVFVLVAGAILVVGGGSSIVTQALGQLGSAGGSWQEGPWEAIRAVAIALQGVALGLCAWRVTSGHSLSTGAVWALPIIGLVGWLLGGALWVAWCIQRGIPTSDGSPSMVAMGIITSGGWLPAIAVIVWYWWPVLRGRVSPALDPDVPHCARCGYNLTGNVSGVCPECGTPVALVVPTSA